MDLKSELKPPFSTTQETPEESLVNHFKICGTMKVTPAHSFKDEGTILDSFKQSIELALCEICFQKMVYLLIQLLVYDFLDTSFKDSYNYFNSCIERMHKKYLSLIFRQIHGHVIVKFKRTFQWLRHFFWMTTISIWRLSFVREYLLFYFVSHKYTCNKTCFICLHTCTLCSSHFDSLHCRHFHDVGT